MGNLYNLGDEFEAEISVLAKELKIKRTEVIARAILLFKHASRADKVFVVTGKVKKEIKVK